MLASQHWGIKFVVKVLAVYLRPQQKITQNLLKWLRMDSPWNSEQYDV